MKDKTPMSREEETLKSIARQANPSPSFTNELEKKLMNAHKPEKTGFFSFGQIASTAGWAIGLAALTLAFIWVIRSIAPQPKPQPAAGDTPAPQETRAAPTPSGAAYKRYGQTLYLQAELPASPTEASVYNYLPEQPATLESARALAAQFGMEGAVYKFPSETASLAKDFLVVDGERHLHVRSDQYFQYYYYPRYAAAVNSQTPPVNAEAVIEDFLQSHGFDFPHRIQPSEIYGGYVAVPLTPDGHILCYEYFKCAGLHFQFDEQGVIYYIDGILPKYELIGQYGIISAEEALKLYIDPALTGNPNATMGSIEGMHSPTPTFQTWLRARPLDQTLTLYGYLNSVPSAEGGAPLVTFDGYTATGNTADIPAEYSNAFVEATGQFHEENGVKTFALQSWSIFSNGEESLVGTISQQGDRVILNTQENETFVLPDIPVDLPLPLDNAFVVGVRRGETFEWRSIDQRMIHGGGGGGGGGFGIYKLNLTGTPVPFPTPEPQTLGGGNGEQTYVVREGDTLSKIADQFGVAVEALTLANGLSEPTIFIGQTLVIPVSDSSAPQKVEALRGLVNVTIYKQADGSQRAEYNLWNKDTPFPSLPLKGENLDALQAWQNRPVDVWGTIEMEDGAPTLKVERYEIPFPDLKFQILSGAQTPITLNGQQVTLFTAADGQTYAQLSPDGLYPDGSTVGNLDDEVQIEALIVPGETFGGYPALRVFAASTSSDGSPDLTVTADQINVVEMAGEGEYTPPTMTIERVELVYYMPDPRYVQGKLSPDQRYIQPAWLFAGHYSTGEEFFILIQALKREFLLPEFAPFTPPG